MADHIAPVSGSQTQPMSPPRRRGYGRAALLIILGVLFGSIAGSLVTSALGRPNRHVGRVMAGPTDPAQVDQYVHGVMKYLTIEADATSEQKVRIAAVAKAAVVDLLPLRDQARAVRLEGLALLAASTVDRTAIERFRVRQIELADEVSKRVAQAIADAADVLTTDQRRSLSNRERSVTTAAPISVRW